MNVLVVGRAVVVVVLSNSLTTFLVIISVLCIAHLSPSVGLTKSPGFGQALWRIHPRPWVSSRQYIALGEQGVRAERGERGGGPALAQSTCLRV